MTPFANHRGYASMFRQDHLTLGLFFPIEAYAGAVPEMDIATQLATARLAEEKGFSALYFRDVPLNVPSFGDVGHIYDPWVFMGLVLGQTSRIALATGSIVSTLRHPLHLAKAASIDRLSGQRLLLGLACFWSSAWNSCAPSVSTMWGSTSSTGSVRRTRWCRNWASS